MEEVARYLEKCHLNFELLQQRERDKVMERSRSITYIAKERISNDLNGGIAEIDGRAKSSANLLSLNTLPQHKQQKSATILSDISYSAFKDFTWWEGWWVVESKIFYETVFAGADPQKLKQPRVSRSNRKSSLSKRKRQSLFRLKVGKMQLLLELKLMLKNYPKKLLDFQGRFKTFSIHMSQFYRRRTAHPKQSTFNVLLNNNAVIFYLVLTVNLIYHCAALTNHQFIHLRILPIQTRTKTIPQSCRTLPPAKQQTFLLKVSRNLRDFRLAIKQKMKAAFRAWILFTRLVFRFIQLWSRSTLQFHLQMILIWRQ